MEIQPNILPKSTKPHETPIKKTLSTTTIIIIITITKKCLNSSDITKSVAYSVKNSGAQLRKLLNDFTDEVDYVKSGAAKHIQKKKSKINKSTNLFFRKSDLALSSPI